MQIIILCLIITASIVYVYDVVDFPHNFIARILSVITHKNVTANNVLLPKIFECSLCASTWTTLVILSIFNWHMIPLCFVFGFITTYILTIINIIDKFIKIILSGVNKLLTNIGKYTF